MSNTLTTEIPLVSAGEFSVAKLEAVRAKWQRARSNEFEQRSGEMCTPALAAWAAAMTQKYGNACVRVGADIATWTAALAVVQYGTRPNLWPERFTAMDELRALRWMETGVLPNGVQLLPQA